MNNGDLKNYLKQSNSSYNSFLSSKYKDLPQRNFTQNDQTINFNKSISTLPESNYSTIISALLELQKKIEQNERIKENLNEQKTESSELFNQLKSTENKCEMLNNQLNDVKFILNNYIRKQDDQVLFDKNNCVDISSNIISSKQELNNDKDIHVDREQLKLLAKQKIYQYKIKKLEQKLAEKQSEHVELQKNNLNQVSYEDSNVRDQQSLLKTDIIMKDKNKLPANKKIKFANPENRIPFIIGKSVTKSYSLPANLQEVLYLMKTHRSKLPKRPFIEEFNELNGDSLNKNNEFQNIMVKEEDFLKNSINKNTEEDEYLSENEKINVLASIKAYTEELHQRESEFFELQKIIGNTHEEFSLNHMENELKLLQEKIDKMKKKIKQFKILHLNLSSNSKSSLKSSYFSRKYSQNTLQFSNRQCEKFIHPKVSQQKKKSSVDLLRDLRKIQTALKQDDCTSLIKCL